MKDTLIIIGASGHGKVVADIAKRLNKWKNIRFLDDDGSIKSNLGINVVGTINESYHYKKEADFFVAIGNNLLRKKIQEKMVEEGYSIISLIHPSAEIGEDVLFGNGTVVMAGVVINSSSKIGRGCIINTNSSVDHDNIIEDYVHISPGVNLAGSVKIGSNSWIGIGSTIINNIKICSACIVGAGSVVVKDIKEPGTYVGVPVNKLS